MLIFRVWGKLECRHGPMDAARICFWGKHYFKKWSNFFFKNVKIYKKLSKKSKNL